MNAERIISRTGLHIAHLPNLSCFVRQCFVEASPFEAYVLQATEIIMLSMLLRKLICGIRLCEMFNLHKYNWHSFIQVVFQSLILNVFWQRFMEKCNER